MRLDLVLVFVLLTSLFTYSQSSPPNATVSSPSSAASLAAVVTRLGWDRGRAQLGIVAQGDKTTLDEQGRPVNSIPVVLKIRLDHRLRMELGSGEVMTIADAVGFMRNSRATQASLQLPHVAVSMAAPYFPFLTDVAATNDTSVTVALSGTATIGTEPVVGYTIQRNFPATANYQPARVSSSKMLIWISQNTGLPVKLDFFRLALDNWELAIPFSLYFSQWQTINGVLVPMQIDEGSGGRVFTRMQFSSVQFDSALPDSDFTLTGGAN